MTMNHPVMGNPRPPLPEIIGQLMDKRKVLIGWPACLKRSPPKAAFNNNDIYTKSIENKENLYKQPQESKAAEEEQEPREKSM